VALDDPKLPNSIVVAYFNSPSLARAITQSTYRGVVEAMAYNRASPLSMPPPYGVWGHMVRSSGSLQTLL
jgi:hypothetical protein